MSKKHHRLTLVSSEKVESKICLMRGKKVMLDRHLAELYGVETKILNQAVRRNMDRFPEDFMFQLNDEETKKWRSQIVTSNSKLKMSLRHKPLAFTEQGVAMLSSVLNSHAAICVNIQIIRTFVKLKETTSSYKDLLLKIGQLENKYDKHFQVVFRAIRLLLEDKPKSGPDNKRFDI